MLVSILYILVNKMKNIPKVLTIAFLLLLVLALGLGGFYFYITSELGGQESETLRREAQEGRASETEGEADDFAGKVIEGEGVFAGKFVKIEGGKIFLQEKDEIRQLEIREEITFVLTNQAMDESTDGLDYDKLASAEPMLTKDLEAMLFRDELIVLISIKTEGNFVVHAVTSETRAHPVD